MRLQGKVALITGGGGGIGRETAILFAKEGAQIVVVDVNDGAGQDTVRDVEAMGARRSISTPMWRRRLIARRWWRRQRNALASSMCFSTTPVSCTAKMTTPSRPRKRFGI